MNKRISPLASIKHLGISSNPRAPKADITTAPHLFGDPFGDPDDDDFQEDGDPQYGEPFFGNVNDDTAALFSLVSGDPEFQYGGPSFKKFINNKYTKAAGVGLAAGAAGYGIHKGIQAIKNRRKLLASRLNNAANRQTIVNQTLAKRNAGIIDRKKSIPFQQLIGATLNSSQIDPNSRFIGDMLKNLLDRQAMDTPFLVDTAIGVYAAPNWTCTASGEVNNRYYVPVILQLGIPVLNGAPATVFSITATMPLINGTLTIATPWVMTIAKGFDVRFVVFPWQLVSNTPLPVLGQYRNAAPIIFIVNGLPSTASVTLTVPGSQHGYVQALRTALIRS